MAEMAADTASQLRVAAPGCPHRAPSATSVASGKVESLEYSSPALPNASLAAVADHIGFASVPVLRNSERGPPSLP